MSDAVIIGIAGGAFTVMTALVTAWASTKKAKADLRKVLDEGMAALLDRMKAEMSEQDAEIRAHKADLTRLERQLRNVLDAFDDLRSWAISVLGALRVHDGEAAERLEKEIPKRPTIEA